MYSANLSPKQMENTIMRQWFEPYIQTKLILYISGNDSQDIFLSFQSCFGDQAPLFSQLINIHWTIIIIFCLKSGFKRTARQTRKINGHDANYRKLSLIPWVVGV